MAASLKAKVELHHCFRCCNDPPIGETNF
uniref:Uncharacterized protein n=1 Tax=Arundo donax TaxID=35708 RepID=A0A0A9FG30_ARUDO